MTIMQAIAFEKFGAAPELTELPIPEPRPGEVLVRVQAASVNGFDPGVLGGALQGVYEYEFPVVLGKDYAGEVAAVGAGMESVSVGHMN
ncbi:alcohol dehydrogenase catalytic domain-containing protein [Nocardia sp. NEAU-G5]|uniref:Alcohol dehydrogenase catalytic domain-containing protein n=2 Tax=Nocardia albiluteola TaxID=2842303 RepID=A0ABS6ASL2_9NOCA|nr:alcohol dehydrogenase catalytic domain-containing protein [Nocardia albiluteola]